MHLVQESHTADVIHLTNSPLGIPMEYPLVIDGIVLLSTTSRGDILKKTWD